MKILVDIGHPAHVHYFRNAISILQQKGHQFLITTRDKEVTLDLLKSYQFPYICTGKNKTGVAKKFLSMIRNDQVIWKAARRFKPDLFLSFFSPFAAQVGWMMRKPVIGFTDSEFARLSIKLTKPFTNYIFTPDSFETDFGKDHYRFKGFMETFYLHPRYFVPDANVPAMLGVQPGERYFLMRFVSFNAGHDIGESGMDEQSKLSIAEYLSKKGKLFISSEGALPPHFEQYRIKIPPQYFHSILAFADLYVGEGITTASECAQLGTPAVLINTIRTGYINEQVRRGLVYNFDTAKEALPVIHTLVEDPGSKKNFIQKRDEMYDGLIDCTAFLVQLIDQFPASIPKPYHYA
jgi:uncharacterized protein